MYRFFILICFTLSVKAESETEAAILERLEATERLVQNLFDELTNLKVQDQLQKEEIFDIKKQLQVQQQRNIQLRRLNKRLTASRQKTESLNDDIPTSARNVRNSEVENDMPINRIRRLENEMPVAFFAKMTKHTEHAGVHQNFVFDTVVTNVGHGYNNHLGSFVAPVSGTYAFSTTLVSFYHVNAHAQFVKNGQAVTTMFVSGAESGYDTTSQTIVLQLQKGDDVTVENLDADRSFYGGSHSTFSGFLLFEDYSSSVVVGK